MICMRPKKCGRERIKCWLIVVLYSQRDQEMQCAVTRVDLGPDCVTRQEGLTFLQNVQ
jgi:hypothetical protein